MTDKLFIPAPAGARLDIYEWPVDVIEETPSTISYPLLGWTHRTMSHSTSPDSGTPVFLRGASSMEYEPGGSQTARAVLPGDDSDDIEEWAEILREWLINSARAAKANIRKTLEESGSFPFPKTPRHLEPTTTTTKPF